MKRTLSALCTVVLLFTANLLSAQMTGAYTVPGSYSTIGAAIAALNSSGISGAVTINIAAGHTETATTGGYTLTTTGTSANPIIFQKSGTGANPLITAYVGTATPASATQDGVWRLIGTDYITIDGIDIVDPNTTNPATMEFGYCLFKASAANGCQYNTIRNCVVTLSRVNSVAGSGPSIDGSKGISLINATTDANTTAVTATTTTGSNSFNDFYSNTLLNCHIGICLIGYADATPFLYADTDNDVGGVSAATGNTITNFGGGGTTPSAGVSTLAQYNINVSYNVLNSNNGSGANHAGILRGIYLNTATSANASILSNTVTIKAGGTTQAANAIHNVAGSTAASNTITISGNLIINSSYTTATSGDLVGVLNTASAEVVEISGNTVLNSVIKSTSGQFLGVSSTGGVVSQLRVLNNRVNNVAFHPTTGVFRAFNLTSAAGTSTVTISNNTLQALTCTSTPSGIHSFIFNSSSSAKNEITGNTAINVTFFTTGNVFFINNSNSTEVNVVTGNSITGTLTKSGAGGIFYGYYNFGSPSGGAASISNNNISNVSLSGAATFYGLYVATAVSQTESVTSNSVANITTGAAPAYGIYHSYGASGSAVTGNTVTGLSGGAAVYGITTGNVAGVQVEVNNNLVHTLSSTGASPVYGINQIDGTASYVHHNKIYNLSGSNAGAFVSGIYVAAGASTGVYNNLVGDLRATAALGANAISGIHFNGGTAAGIFYNTVRLNATSTGTSFGTSALYASTVTAVNVRNNIFINNSAPTGTGITVAFRRSEVSLSTYSLTSNNNVYYAGTPGAGNLLYYDGTNSYQTLAAFKAAVSPREANSITENTPFLSTSGASANFLHIDPTIPSYAESGAVNIAGISNDFDGQTRQGNTGYTGLGTAPDIGADEFEPNLPPCSGASSGSITATSFSSCAGQPLSLFSVNYSMGGGTTYQWQAGTAPGGPYTNVGGSNGNHHAYTSSSHSAGVYYFVMVTTCSVGPVTAVSNEISYTVEVSPTASITAPVSVCNGGTITLAGSSDAATGYSWTGPNGFSSTSQNTVINSAGLTAGGQYSLVTTLGQCSSPVSVFSVIVSQATVNLVNPSPSLCYGNSTTLTAVGETGASYNWSSGPTSGSISVTPLVNTVYDVTVTNVYNCTVAATTSISVVNVTIAAQGTSVCPNVNGTLSVNAYTPSFIDWYASSTSTTSIGTGSTFAMSAPTSTTVYAEARSGKADSLFTSVAGTSSFMGEMFDVVPLKAMTIKGLDAQIAAGTGTFEIWYRYGTHVGNSTSNTGWTMAASVTLTSLGNGSLTTIPATLNIPAVAGQTVAFYIVANTGPNVRYSSGGTLGAVYVSNSDLQILYGTTGNTYFNATASPRAFNGQVRYEIPGCTSPRVPVTLTVNPLPSIAIAQNTTAVCYSATASFTASGASTYTWVNGPVSSTFSTTPTTAATYTVNGTSVAGCTNSATASVTINALPVITVAQSAAAVCYSTPVTFTASGASTYSWVNGPSSATFSDSPLAASLYTVAGTAANGCSASVTASVGVNPLPVLLVSQSANTVCATYPVTFSVTGADTYTWNTTSNDSVMVDNPASATLYTVTGTNSFGCESSVTASVGVNPLPLVVISQSSPSVCANGPLSFTAAGASQYLWSTGATTGTMVLTPASNTFVTVTGTDANGCFAKDSVAVSVSPLPTVSIAQSASSVCLGASATFTATGAGTYSWSSGSQVSTESVTPAAYTVYTVTGTLPTGCAATATVELHTLALPAVSVTADRDTICENESTELDATGAVSYAWLPSGGTGATLPVTPASTTIYTVTGTGANNCENIATVTVVVDPCTGLSKNAAADGAMRLYPNPTSGLVNLEFTVEGVREIRVLNAVGQVILEKTSAQAVETIDLGAYARGFYYVQVKGSEGERTFRVITQN